MMLTRRHALLGGLAATLVPSGPAGARPARYVLEPDASRVAFAFRLNGIGQTGTMPVARADILVDPARLTASKVDVEVAADEARTGLIFATQALKAASVLDTANHPRIRFVSTQVALGPGGRISDGARLSGDLTLKGVTRPLSFDAGLFRLPGTAPDDLRNLTVHLRGTVLRSDFGASGYLDLVADAVHLDITAAIRVDT